MRKILLLLVLLSAMSMTAKKPAQIPTCPWDKIVTISGDANTWCQNAPSVRFVWDYMDAIEVNFTCDKQTGEWSTNVLGLFIQETDTGKINYAINKFTRDMAAASPFVKGKGIPQLIKDPQASVDYEFRIKIDTIDTGNAAATFWLGGGMLQSDEKQKRGGTIACGTVTIYDMKAQREVCVIRLIRARGIGAGIGLLDQRLAGLYYNMVLVKHCCKRDPNTFNKLKE